MSLTQERVSFKFHIGGDLWASKDSETMIELQGLNQCGSHPVLDQSRMLRGERS